MAKLTLDGVEIEVPDGSPLVEVIKQQGTFISNLCYIDGLPPYAGCRTCLVEVEGARGLQLACTSRVADGMDVRTQTAQVLDARQAVLSIINANHSDRCLTCHRRVHCMPGDICLRDDTVTHRCLTCAKNYRCELQTTNEMLQMANYEPWLGEERTYYESEPPEADRANPFLEFDPQMCIICTRCVRACDEIRHTGAVTLAGRGGTTQIAFGAGGAIHESNCDFCGSCIDVCPTATLLEKPNKWIAKTEEWVSTTCNTCSVGCTLSMGVRNGKVVMVKPDRLNPVSDSQICVRGRFHYDAVTTRERLTRHLVRQGELLTNTTYDAAMETAVSKLADVIKANGPESVGFLVAPWATNEEAYLAQRIARGLIGTENVDSTAGPVSQAVEASLTNAFGTHALPSNLEDLATADVIVVIADDLESSHNVAALRVKDAVVKNGARLIVISSRYGEVCDFIAPPPSGSIMPSPQRVHSAAPTGVWLRPSAGGEVATVAALAGKLNANAGPATRRGVDAAELDEAADILRNLGDGKLAVVFAPSAASPLLAGLGAAAAANLTIAAKGSDAASNLHVLPIESNAHGVRDMGAKPGANAKGLREMLSGGVKALVVVGDNPMMLTPDKDAVEAGLRGLDALVVIDGAAQRDGRLRRRRVRRPGVLRQGRHAHERRPPHRPGDEGRSRHRRPARQHRHAERAGDGAGRQPGQAVPDARRDGRGDHGRGLGDGGRLRGRYLRLAGVGAHARTAGGPEQGRVPGSRPARDALEQRRAAADELSRPVHEPRRRHDPVGRSRQAAPRGVPGDQPGGRRRAADRPEPAGAGEQRHAGDRRLGGADGRGREGLRLPAFVLRGRRREPPAQRRWLAGGRIGTACLARRPAGDSFRSRRQP